MAAKSTFWPVLHCMARFVPLYHPAWLLLVRNSYHASSPVMKYTRQTQKDINLYWNFYLRSGVPPTDAASDLTDWPQHLEAFINLCFPFIYLLFRNFLNCTSVKYMEYLNRCHSPVVCCKAGCMCRIKCSIFAVVSCVSEDIVGSVVCV